MLKMISHLSNLLRKLLQIFSIIHKVYQGRNLTLIAHDKSLENFLALNISVSINYVDPISNTKSIWDICNILQYLLQCLQNFAKRAEIFSTRDCGRSGNNGQRFYVIQSVANLQRKQCYFTCRLCEKTDQRN